MIFGAKIGREVEIKPCVNIKYPWQLTIGNEVWIGENVWIAAGAIVNHGITAAPHSVLTCGSVATKNLEAYTIYQGNPAQKVRIRNIS